MFNFNSYCDESETDGEIYCVSGYVAPENEWWKLDVPWATELMKLRCVYQREFSEFKMYDCVAGDGDFKGIKIREREAIQERFIDIINSLGLIGIASGVHLPPFNRIPDKTKDRFALKPGRRERKPYILAFRCTIQAMANLLLNLPRGEHLAAIFDEQEEFQGRAKELWNYLKKRSATLPFVERLGSITFTDSKRFAGLQAADVLAFESRRYFREVKFNTKPKPAQWQWLALNSVRKIHCFPMGRKELDQLYEEA